MERRRLRKRSAALALTWAALLVWCLLPGAANAGIRYTIPIAVFSYEHHPAEPRETYAGGELGIVMPGYSRSYLYVAHRWMDGAPLTLEEQREMQKVWWGVPGETENRPSVWRDLRASLPIPAPAFDEKPHWRRSGLDTRGYLQFRACTPHAFERAAERLREHVDRFGADSAEVRAWVEAQDLVFHHCSLPGDGTFPSEAPAGLPVVIREDRRYQIAAARFVATHFEEAEELFRQIEPDPESWAGLWAPYMVGRSILWQARTHLGDEEAYRRLLREAQVALEAVLRRDDLAETHDAARHLLIRILAITDQEAAARLLGLRLSSPLRAASRVQDWEQYASLLYHNTTQRVSYRKQLKPHSQLRKLGARDALTDWILAFQSQDEAAHEYSLQRWRETRSIAWLVACLSKAEAGGAATGELLAEAAQVPPGPGWASVQFYRATLLSATGQREQARAVLDLLLPEIASRSSSWNRALALRAQLSRTVDEMFQFGVRQPASFGTLNSWESRTSPWDWGDWATENYDRYLRRGPLLMPEAAGILDGAVPLARFADLAMEAKRLPDEIRRDRRRRGVGPSRATRRLRTPPSTSRLTVAEVAPDTAADMKRFSEAASASRRLLAIHTMLKFPGMSARVYPGIGRGVPFNEMHLSGFKLVVVDRPRPDLAGSFASRAHRLADAGRARAGQARVAPNRGAWQRPGMALPDRARAMRYPLAARNLCAGAVPDGGEQSVDRPLPRAPAPCLRDREQSNLRRGSNPEAAFRVHALGPTRRQRPRGWRRRLEGRVLTLPALRALPEPLTAGVSWS